MKKFIVLSVLTSILVFMSGCEEDSDSNNNLVFENMSSYRVSVIPLTTEWSAFTLEPGELKKLYDIRDIDYRLSSKISVQEGSASTERYIIIVNAPPKKS